MIIEMLECLFSFTHSIGTNNTRINVDLTEKRLNLNITNFTQLLLVCLTFLNLVLFDEAQTKTWHWRDYPVMYLNDSHSLLLSLEEAFYLHPSHNAYYLKD